MTRIGFIFLLGICPLVSKAQDCELRKDKGGVKVYACSQDTSKYKLLKAEFSIPNTTFEQLRAFIMDVPNYPTWQYNMVEAQVLKTINDHSLIIRSVTDAPWPVTDREMIVQFSGVIDTGSNLLTMHIKSIPSYDHPKNDKLVRVPFSDATWLVHRDRNNNLQAVYTLRIDPGGALPVWLVNMAIAEGPFESFSKLKNQLAERSKKAK